MVLFSKDVATMKANFVNVVDCLEESNVTNVGILFSRNVSLYVVF